MKSIVLFDGDCNFCNQSIQFIIKRDPKGYFQFASLQSALGKTLLKKYEIDETIDSIVLIDKNNSYIKSDAILNICRNLKGIWKIFTIFILIPRPIRNFCYEKFAKNRYRWFGKQEHCMLPSPEVRKRFLD
ncbi:MULTISPECIES: DCC1-like thiol-disulfide oxidoreductase family protein [Bacillus]|uniref:DCC1-like thiol-disulfide oxidoreductase family protein n=1 Tax=Bacillus TaxID=1386 RepID=UPI000B4A82BB|nr:thiol-disulfide oxidoreductase DCC family protein [Bacillus cereus]MDA2439228.1 thiol-disulfide oxidoreductase DCC family protein [Bacillus cereus]MDA2445484.1 thiol-disulfide oxidoreductase DCC family protein [Bacillus cereus]MDA2704750.1 thiol-disulfide oxidoreductase DCC family protein [Bacillus cereus]MDA2710510.1 thiol-disulfide oxidoreductase DCC family protein [Bacillus cereus]HDR6217278.1 thiol-disulfide oxidoreductase DCC family protein [Bacillus cereus]